MNYAHSYHMIMVHQTEKFGPFWIVAPILIHSDEAATYHFPTWIYFWVYYGLLTIYEVSSRNRGMNDILLPIDWPI